ncbi:MAG TPA: hypothetical protein VK031_03595, partial [Tissierellaceae bacterium]|nr:hypothetical protein [Tissierellaceae bacterium]
AQGSGEYTVQDSEVVIKDKFGNIIEQDSITAEGSKEFTVNTELPVKNTIGQDVGTEIDGEIIVGDSNITLKDSEDNILSSFDVPAENNEEKVIDDSTAIIKDSEGNILKSENILAEGSKDITITDSTSTIKDSSGNTLYSENILAEGTKETTIADSTYVIKNQDGDIIAQGSILAEGSVEIVVVGYRPLILTYNTNLYTDAIIELPNVGTDPKDIIVRDSLGVVVKTLVGNTDDIVMITDLPAGIYDVEVSMEETSRMIFNPGGRERVQATLVELKQWGDVVWGSNLNYLFMGCENLMITADDLMKMSTVGVTDRVMTQAFERIGGITNMEWVEALPFYTMTNIFGLFHQADGVIDVVLDFNNASYLTVVGQMFRDGDFKTITINNMGSTLTATGQILYTTGVPNLEKVLFNDLQLSQNISGWRNGTAQDYITFFENIGDRSGKDQRTITIRTTEWDKLDANQKDYVDNI